jgi:hypothetical protein
MCTAHKVGILKLTSPSFYGYDQGVFGNVIISEDFLHTFGYPSANMQGEHAHELIDV